MKSKQIWKMTVDILMTATLLLLMSYSLVYGGNPAVGEAVHEWLGVGMFVLFVLHHFLHRKWSLRVRKGKYTPYRVPYRFFLFGHKRRTGSGADRTYAVCLLGICIYVVASWTALARDHGHGREAHKEIIEGLQMDTSHSSRFDCGLWGVCFYQAGLWKLYAPAVSFCVF